MKNYFLFALFFIQIPFSITAQENLDCKVKITQVSTSQKLRDILSFQRIEYQKIKINCKEFKQKDFYVLSKSYLYNDTLKKSNIIIDTLYSSKRNEKYFGTKGTRGKTLKLRLLTKITNEDVINIQFHTVKTRKLLEYTKLPSDNYSLRDISSFSSKSNNRIPFSVITLPWKDKDRPGMLFYCELDIKAKSIDNWGELYGIEHYILFEVVIE